MLKWMHVAAKTPPDTVELETDVKWVGQAGFRTQVVLNFLWIDLSLHCDPQQSNIT